VGQCIEIPLFDAMFSALGFRAQRVHRPATSELADDVARAMGRAGGRLAGIHRCKDGRWVYVHAGNKNARDFAEAAGAAAFPEGADVREQVRALFETRNAAEWETLGDAVRSEVVEFRSSAEWLREPHALESGMIARVDDPTHGSMLQPGLQVRLSGAPGAIAHPAVPLDSSRAEVLAEIAEGRLYEPLPQSPPSDRPVLDGVRVLDLCIVLAGPTCGRTLAEYGADVIKIEMPSRTGAGARAGRPSFHPFNIDVNRGKRSIVLDLKTPAGLDVFWKLLERADVVVQNFRDGIADRLGIGYEAVRQRRPDIVYASLNTYGYAGPWKGRPGHEQLAQAATGMAVRFGGDGKPPLLQHVGAINDYGTGLMGAFAVSLALLHRQRTGEGQHVSTSLAQTACILQSPFLFDHAGKEWSEPRGQEARGSGALQRLYATKDGWLFLGGRADQTWSLERVEGLQGAARDADLGVFLERRLREEPTSVWVERLVRAGLGAHEVTRLARLMDDPWVRARGLIVTLDSPELGPIDQVGVTTQMSRTRLRPGHAAPSPGADARGILDEHGIG
jgi:crotonobetainyl-CoA:carnitine CoA-transferase CaiB-like acyl-CoA transferase